MNTVCISTGRFFFNVERLGRVSTVFFDVGFKTGICAAAPLHQDFSLLALSNNTCIADTLTGAYNRFMHLYRVRAHVHHCEPGGTCAGFEYRRRFSACSGTQVTEDAAQCHWHWHEVEYRCHSSFEPASASASDSDGV